jgi:glycosyltransferase involved in cell wall biosynthesis
VARALTRAGAVVCTSAAERAELESFLPSSLGKLHTILNGVDQAGPIDASRRTAMRRGLGIDPDTVLGLFVGGLEDLKAPLLAATAAEQVRTGGTRLVLAFVGTGPLEAAVRDLRSSAVRLLGFRSDVPELLSAADMLIHPSEREGLPYSVLEAMAHGVPVIGTDCPGTREAVATTGVLVPNGDERSLAEAMTRLAKDDRLRISLGRAARARAADHFGVGVFLAKTAQLYRELTNPRLSPGPGRPSTVPLSD